MSGTGRQRARADSRYSRFVGLMRFLLPTIALFMVGLVVLWPQIVGGIGTIMPMVASEKFAGAEAMLMRKPRYVGETENREPYEVVASTAVVDPEEPDKILLDGLDARLERMDDANVRLLASDGIYDRSKSQLDLSGEVELLTEDGYRFETSEARIRLDRGRVDGDRPISGAGPTGTLQADRFVIRDGGDLMRFDGNVRVVVTDDAGPGS
jgi:lipopolysaccharide export system protein LptC